MGLFNRAADLSQAAELLHHLQECALLRADDPAVCLDLQGNELGDELTDHLWGHLQRAQTNQVTAALAEPKAQEAPLLSSDIRFWSSGDTKTGPPVGLLMGA